MRDKRAWKLLPCQRKFCESIVWCIWGVEEKGMFKYALFIYWYIVDGHEIHQAPTMTMVWKSEVSRRTNLYHKMRTGKTCVRVYTKKLFYLASGRSIWHQSQNTSKVFGIYLLVIVISGLYQETRKHSLL